MGSRQEIFENLRRNTAASYPYPDLSGLEDSAITYADKVGAFSASLEAAGGKAVAAPDGAEPGPFISSVIRERYPEAVNIVSALADGIPGLVFDGAVMRTPDDYEAPASLDGTDVAVVRARFGVAENGAVWIDEYGKFRALLFIAEALVVVLDRKDIVDNMHLAYARPELENPRSFGTFISGPSKTADIEQALVFGAHGARSVTVVLV